MLVKKLYTPQSILIYIFNAISNRIKLAFVINVDCMSHMISLNKKTRSDCHKTGVIERGRIYFNAIKLSIELK